MNPAYGLVYLQVLVSLSQAIAGFHATRDLQSLFSIQDLPNSESGSSGESLLCTA